MTLSECTSPLTCSRRRRYPWREHGIGLLPLALVTVLLFLCIGGEQAIAGWFKNCRLSLPAAATFFSFFSSYGNLPFYGLFLYLFLRSRSESRRKDWRFVIQYLILLVLLLLVTDMLKIWIGRPRPGVPGEYILLSLRRAQHSFPSNHMTETVFSVLSLAVFFEKRPFTLLCSLWIVLMGVARMYLGRHHPTDLLGSALIGSIVVYLLWRLNIDEAETGASIQSSSDGAAAGDFRWAR